jgi:hypothetical protein
MRSLYFVLLVLLVSAISFSHVGLAFASPTLTIVIVANNGPRIVDLKIMALVPHPWGAGDSDSLYGWGLVEENQGISIQVRSQKTLLYDLSPGLYVINVCWGANLAGIATSITNSKLIVVSSDVTVNFVVN